MRYQGAEIWAKQNKVSDFKNTKYCITTVLAKKNSSTKRLFLVKKKCFYVIFFFSCLKMVFCELMLLELGDLLVLSLLRNFISAARWIFSCKYFSCFIQYIWRFRNQFKIIMILQTRFNFNFNLVESWDSFILNSSMPPTHPTTQRNFEFVSEPPDILNETAKIFTRKYWP